VTRPNPLVLEGSEVKLRLEAERTAHKTPVHVDWVRFTCLLRNAPAPSADNLFPATISVWDENYRKAQLQKVLRDIPDCEFVPSAQALDLANEICTAMGSDFVVHADIGKGHDFYKFRWSIHRNGSECGWVGFLSSGDSPRQQSQAQTIHANLYGSACTFAQHGWNDRIAAIVDKHDAKLTRADLALDFFDGGIELEAIKTDYLAGLMDSGGKRLKCNMVGDWANGAERSFYIGSKEAGKQTNIYEKGDQLFGRDAHNPWCRIELRYGNKLRVLSSDMLRRPADFFAGASDWHALQLARLSQDVAPEQVPTTQKLAVQTIEAEVHRAIKWANETAGPSLAMFVKYATESQLFEVIENKKLPGRMSKFSVSEISAGFRRAIRSFSTVEGPWPAFA
jgi:phage replication initiation protein